MPPTDQELALTLVREANRYMSSDRPDRITRESDLNRVKEVLGLAEKLLAGEANDEDRALALDLAQPPASSRPLPPA